MRVVLFSLTALLAGCIVQEGPPSQVGEPAPPAYPPPAYEAPPAATSVYVEPPEYQPQAIAVGWAPPPMLVEVPPPMPFFGAVWVGGYWVWQGDWLWAHGHWMAPPHPEYVWVHPYYEHRSDEVIFIDGHWAAPGVVFIPPRPGYLPLEVPAPGVIPGPRPLGPEGCFVPAPPGSRAGIIIPAPVGTAPAVVTSAPPVVNVGMRITNITNVTNVTNITRVTNVTIVAPASATANGRAFSGSVPAAPHLAAARPTVVPARAPEPVSTRPLPVYAPGSRPPVLPHAQPPEHEPHEGTVAAPARAGAGAAPPPRPQVEREYERLPAHEKPQERPQEKPQAPHPESGKPVKPEPQPHEEGKREGSKGEKEKPAERE